MKNKEKYPNTGDAIEAYKGYCYGMSLLVDGHVDPFEDWLEKDVNAYSLCNREAESENTDKPHPSSDLILGAAGLGALYMAARQIVDSDPHLLAKSMQQSPNAEVREYGYRVELAIEKSRNAESKKQEAT